MDPGRFPKGLAEQTKEYIAADRYRTLFEEEDVCLALLRNTSATFTPSDQVSKKRIDVFTVSVGDEEPVGGGGTLPWMVVVWWCAAWCE